jgi:hypothetical protein
METAPIRVKRVTCYESKEKLRRCNIMRTRQTRRADGTISMIIWPKSADTFDRSRHSPLSS